jgi:hypothetical protein
MTARRPPSQRNVEYTMRHQARQLQSMAPGALGGRLASAAPVPLDPAYFEGGYDDTDAGVDQVLGFEESPKVVAAAGNQTLYLTHTPIDGTLHITWNGLDQPQSVWSIEDNRVTVLDPTSLLLAGDELVAQYLYSDSVFDAGSYFEEVMADGPLAYYRLGDTGDLGLTLVDSSGNGHDGTLTGNAGATVNQFKPALILNDSDGAIDFIPSARGDADTTSGWADVATWTAEAWIRPDVLSGQRTIFCHDDDGSANEIAWRLDLGGTKVKAWLNRAGVGTDDSLTGATTLVVGSIYYLVASYDGATLKVYVNGALDGSASAPGTTQVPIPPTPLRIGALLGSAEEFDGIIDEVAFYSGALSDDRIMAHYQAGVGA